jgi:hypothetical protein
LHPIVGNSTNLVNALVKFKDPKIAFVGSQKFFLNNREYSEATTTRLFERNVFNRESTVKERTFIAGSIFMITTEMLDMIYDDTKAYPHIVKCYKESKPGKPNEQLDPYPYAFERLFGYYSYMKGYSGVGI